MHLKDLGNLTNIINEGKQLGSMLLLSGNASDVLEKSFEGLNAAQILTKTSTMGLTEAQQLELIQMYATDKANYQNALSTADLSASQKGATASTLGLSTAFKSLWATLIK